MMINHNFIFIFTGLKSVYLRKERYILSILWNFLKSANARSLCGKNRNNLFLAKITIIRQSENRRLQHTIVSDFFLQKKTLKGLWTYSRLTSKTVLKKILFRPPSIAPSVPLSFRNSLAHSARSYGSSQPISEYGYIVALKRDAEKPTSTVRICSENLWQTIRLIIRFDRWGFMKF